MNRQKHLTHFLLHRKECWQKTLPAIHFSHTFARKYVYASALFPSVSLSVSNRAPAIERKRKHKYLQNVRPQSAWLRFQLSEDIYRMCRNTLKDIHKNGCYVCAANLSLTYNILPLTLDGTWLCLESLGYRSQKIMLWMQFRASSLKRSQSLPLIPILFLTLFFHNRHGFQRRSTR